VCEEFHETLKSILDIVDFSELNIDHINTKEKERIEGIARNHLLMENRQVKGRPNKTTAPHFDLTKRPGVPEYLKNQSSKDGMNKSRSSSPAPTGAAKQPLKPGHMGTNTMNRVVYHLGCQLHSIMKAYYQWSISK